MLSALSILVVKSDFCPPSLAAAAVLMRSSSPPREASAFSVPERAINDGPAGNDTVVGGNVECMSFETTMRLPPTSSRRSHEADVSNIGLHTPAM